MTPMLRQTLPMQTDKVKAEKEFMQTLIDYGTSVTRERSPDYKKQVTNEREEADKAFVEALPYAKKYKSPIEQAELYKDKLDNLFRLTARFDTESEMGKLGYRRETQGILKGYKEALDTIKGQPGNPATAMRAQLTGDLANVELKRAVFVNDEFATDAEDHFEEALKLWSQCDPRVGAKNDAEIKTREDKFDKAEAEMLKNYRSLLGKMGTDGAKRAGEIDERYGAVLNRIRNRENNK